MFRPISILAVVCAVAGCSWPPSLAAPPAVPNAAAPVEEPAETVRAPERPAVPRVSPPAVPRLGGGRGGLL